MPRVVIQPPELSDLPLLQKTMINPEYESYSKIDISEISKILRTRFSLKTNIHIIQRLIKEYEVDKLIIQKLCTQLGITIYEFFKYLSIGYYDDIKKYRRRISKMIKEISYSNKYNVK